MRSEEEIKERLEQKRDFLKRRGSMAEDEDDPMAAMAVAGNTNKHKLIKRTLEYVTGEREYRDIGEGIIP